MTGNETLSSARRWRPWLIASIAVSCVVAAILGGVFGTRAKNKSNGEASKTLGAGVFMGPTTPTALDKVLTEEAKNYTGMFGQPLPSNVPSTPDKGQESASAPAGARPT